MHWKMTNRKMNKYKNIKNSNFHSKKEERRFKELQLLQKAGEIYGLKSQYKFELIPKQVDENGKCLERACNYIADFVYYSKDNQLIVEDVKSIATKTKDYIIKRKLMLLKHKIKIQEII